MNRKASTLISLGISAALIAGAIWFLSGQHYQFGYGGGRWSMPYPAMMGGGYMGISMILFWVVIIAAIVLVVAGALSGGASSTRDEAPPAPPSAMDILKRRYASGEIDKTQYETMKKDIES